MYDNITLTYTDAGACVLRARVVRWHDLERMLRPYRGETAAQFRARMVGLVEHLTGRAEDERTGQKRAMLTPDEQRVFRAHLRQVDARNDCVVCGAKRDWAAEAELITWVTAGVPPINHTAVACTCPACAVITFFSPAVIGR